MDDGRLSDLRDGIVSFLHRRRTKLPRFQNLIQVPDKDSGRSSEQADPDKHKQVSQ
jgi:hypothetical protein